MDGRAQRVLVQRQPGTAAGSCSGECHERAIQWESCSSGRAGDNWRGWCGDPPWWSWHWSSPVPEKYKQADGGALAGGWWASEGEPWVASCSSGAPAVKAGCMDPTGQYPQAPGLKLAPKPASALLVGLLQLRDWVQGELRSSTLPSLPGCIAVLSPKAPADEPASPLSSRPQQLGAGCSGPISLSRRQGPGDL